MLPADAAAAAADDTITVLSTTMMAHTALGSHLKCQATFMWLINRDIPKGAQE
jgi:hypothetical protein